MMARAKSTVMWTMLGLLASVGITASQEPVARQDCTVTVEPGQSIQQAIDQVSPGAVICLEEGVFEVLEGLFFDLKITKAPLTLRGAGPRKTILKNAVLRIQGKESPLEDIVIEGLAILASDTPGQIPFLVEISSAEVTAKSVRIGTDALTAIEPRRAAGILLDSESILRLEESRLFGLHVAIFSDAGKIEIQRSLVYGSECGVVLAGGPQEEFVLLNEVRLAANGIGLIAAKGVRMRMQRSVVELQNLGFVGCGFLETGSSLPVGAAGEGILLQGQSVLVAVESRIANNHSYGVAAYLKRCGFQEDSFTGRVELIDTVVEGNEQDDLCLPTQAFTELPAAEALTSAPIYRASTPEPPSTTAAEALAHRLLGLEAPAVELHNSKGPWYLRGLQKVLRLPTRQQALLVSNGSAQLWLSREGMLTFYDASRLARAGVADATIASSVSEAQAQAEAFLTQEQLRLPVPGRLSLHSAGLQTLELTEELKALGATEPPRFWVLGYRYELPTSDSSWLSLHLPTATLEEQALSFDSVGVSVGHPIEPLELWIGADGEVILANWLWWAQLEAVQSLPVRSFDETIELAGPARQPEALWSSDEWRVGEAVFITILDSAEQQYLMQGAAASPSAEIWLYPAYGRLSATDFAPLAQLNVPEGKQQEEFWLVETGCERFIYWEVLADRPVRFQAWLHGGTPPFVYEWQLDDSWQVTSQPESVWTLKPGPHTLRLTVRDAHGLVDTQTISIGAKPEETVSQQLSVSGPEPAPSRPPSLGVWVWVLLGAAVIAWVLLR